jgi:hypothetical protein
MADVCSDVNHELALLQDFTTKLELVVLGPVSIDE